MHHDENDDDDFDSDDLLTARERHHVDARDARHRRRAPRVRAPPPASVHARDGTVVRATSRTCVVRRDGADHACTVAPALGPGAVVVGDVVGFEPRGGAYVVTAVRPRGTRLSRPDPHDPRRERVLAANVDVVAVVVAVAAPPLHPRVIDRFLVATARGGAAPVVCVNKVDLLGDDDRARRDLAETLAPYRAAGVAVYECSTRTREGLDALRARLAGRTVAFAGHSGVGKSSLCNALHPALAAATGDVSAGNARGTHTTTAAELYELPDGTRVVDTPGVRAFGLWDVTAADLAGYFPEFDALRARCRYGDCAHTDEPACAVRAAAERAEIPRARYETYLRVLASID